MQFYNIDSMNNGNVYGNHLQIPQHVVNMPSTFYVRFVSISRKFGDIDLLNHEDKDDSKIIVHVTSGTSFKYTLERKLGDFVPSSSTETSNTETLDCNIGNPDHIVEYTPDDTFTQSLAAYATILYTGDDHHKKLVNCIDFNITLNLVLLVQSILN